jgi:hypothetical protein
MRHRVQLVRQRGDKDCGIAVLAMITGQGYEEIRSRIPLIDGEFGGVFGVHLKQYLEGAGFATVEKHLFHLNKRRNPWPPLPFAPLHYCEVVPGKGKLHWVVMLADGTVLDPIADEPRWLSDYMEVNCVTGVYPVSE